MGICSCKYKEKSSSSGLYPHTFFSEVHVTRSLVLCVCFVDRCLSFFFSHCVICSSSIYGFRLPLWYLQTLLKTNHT